MREYFIDQEKYFYLILLHLHAACCVGAISLTAIGMLIADYFKHICATFKVAKYIYEYRNGYKYFVCELYLVY